MFRVFFIRIAQPYFIFCILFILKNNFEDEKISLPYFNCTFSCFLRTR
jgi:hypothetical protein